LGPSVDEIAAVEGKIENLTGQKDQIENQLAEERQIRANVTQKLQEAQDELTQLKEITGNQSQEYLIRLAESEERKEALISQLYQVEAELERYKEDFLSLREENSKLFSDVQLLNQNLQQTMQERDDFTVQMKKEAEENESKLVREKEDAVFRLSMAKQAEVEQLKAVKGNEIESLKQYYQNIVVDLQNKHVEEIQNIKQVHEKEMKNMKQLYDEKVRDLRETIQKLNNMLPDRDEKDGWLTKQGGGVKTWKRRYFILKTNFICYYKDSKNLKHPQGVIDLNDCKVCKVDAESKKTFTFNIITTRRTYLIKGDSDEDVDGWISSIEKAKAKFKSEANIRTSFLRPTSIRVIN